jgi:phosphosulfolactate synthase
VEISNGTVEMGRVEKVRLIAQFAEEFRVISEVGYKDSARSLALSPADWIASMEEELAAGAVKTIAEARESGTSGICGPDGSLLGDLLDAILDSGLDPSRIVFEAPTKAMQAHLVTRVGANVNLANIAFDDVIGLETLRVGLRSDTFLWAESQAGTATETSHAQ